MTAAFPVPVPSIPALPDDVPPADARAPLYRVADLRAYLAGAWRIRRALVDRRLGRRGRFEGGAEFVAQGEDVPGGEDLPAGEDVLAYREEGRLVLAGFETLAHQRYLYAFPTAGRAEVRFTDGRAFHPLDLGAGRWTAEHLCGADLYRGSFRALGPDSWRAEWRIVGPRKDQVLVSRFTRGA
jgi:hypothetical protein